MAVTIANLQSQHGGEWGEHPDFPVDDWQQAVASDDTRLGYWSSVKAQIEEAEDEEDVEDE
jgi:hypothetical protein